MNILLVSQCDKRALTETRRILDQFAERRGDRTWQTPITHAGLDTLRRLLRKSARKNSAVACHWIRGRDHSELLWIVGDASRFNEVGAVPTNTTRRDVLRRQDENDWHSLEAIHLFVELAALLHDLGKACAAFQARLAGKLEGRNQYRHEWISLRLFQAFVGDVGSDEQWLSRLANPDAYDDASWLTSLRCDQPGKSQESPIAGMPPIAQAVAWLVLTHHRLPLKPVDDGGYYGQKVAAFSPRHLDLFLEVLGPDWNERAADAGPDEIKRYWSFPHGLPVTTDKWRTRAGTVAERLLKLAARPDNPSWLRDPYIMHIGRMVLMLADHHYSSLTKASERVRGEADYPLWANTDSKTGRYNQPLDEHLLGVAKHSKAIVHTLPRFETHLPRLARHRGLRKRTTDPRFRWQDRATDAARGMRERAARNGAFIVNMASTGCGKTLGNAKIMNALADPRQGMRCAFALGLRTLTLQTGRAFRDLLMLSDDELAIRVGGAPNRELFNHFEELAERSGSASTQALFPEDSDARVLFEGNDEHELLRRAMKDPRVSALLSAPMLACTVDHLVPATESQRGGRQIAPMLRLMSSDLVLDELDDFDIKDLPALTRLVHWAGLLGTRVLVSSATLPPALVQGMFDAYSAGRAHFQRNRGERPGEPVNVCCAWFDEHDQRVADCPDADVFRSAHDQFTGRRSDRLAKAPVRRRARLVKLSLTGVSRDRIPHDLAAAIREQALMLHEVHAGVDPVSGHRVSFGLVRMANIDPLIDVAMALCRLEMPEGVRVHLCVYHARFPLLVRSVIETRLDAALDRRKPDAVFQQSEVRACIDSHPEDEHLFIVLGSPVTEVGRDHDYDWAVVEPSSMRSLIQLAGRVRRHRAYTCEEANIALFDHNLRCFSNKDEPAYCRPGFEDAEDFRLATHELRALLRDDEINPLDARPRIVEGANLDPHHRFVDLEHARLRYQMLKPEASQQPRARGRGRSARPRANAALIWTHELAHLTGVLAQQQPFREKADQEVTLAFLPDEDEQALVLHRVRDAKEFDPRARYEKVFVPSEAPLTRLPDEAVRGKRVAPWFEVDLLEELGTLAEAQDLSLAECAARYATLTARASQNGWRYHPVLGFTAQR